MKIVLFGKNGQLGWELQHILPVLGETIQLGRDELDISNIVGIKSNLHKLKPNLIINTAAYTEVDKAETEPGKAMEINAVAPGVMAEVARELGTTFIHYSTDYVFDGKSNTPYLENNKTNPLNMYGRSKLAGEEKIIQAGGAYFNIANELGV